MRTHAEEIRSLQLGLLPIVDAPVVMERGKERVTVLPPIAYVPPPKVSLWRVSDSETVVLAESSYLEMPCV